MTGDKMSALTVSEVYVGLFSNYLEQLQTKRPELNLKKIAVPIIPHSYSECLSLEFVEDFVSSIVQITKNKSLGLDIGEKIHPSDYGVFGYAVMNCSTLLQALRLVERHVMLLNQSFTVTLRELNEEMHVELETSSSEEIGRILVELQMASVCHMATFLAGSYHQADICMTEIHFKHSPMTDISRYQTVFNCPVLFNQDKNKIVVAEAILSKRVRSASPKMLLILQKKIKRLQDEMNDNVSLGQRVCDFLEGYVGTNGVPSALIVAQHFNISLSTLKKHLHQEHLNYTTICDEVRRNMAIKMVVHSSDQLKNISDYLGFSNSSAFNRAFRRWTKITPAEYRRKHFRHDDLNAPKSHSRYERKSSLA
ncbi:MAG: AraC-like DNA-binding protein [Pseudohongiellaceae bacterium]|jgi:AraC-like DNA-binding protein